TRAALPAPLPAGWRADATANGSVIALRLTPPANAPDPGRLYYFADADHRIEASLPQTRVTEADGAYRLELPVSHDLTGGFTRLAGVLRAERGLAADGAIVEAIALDVPLTGTPSAGPKPALALPANDWQAAPLTDASTLSPPLALVLAFGGGLLLNLMPCVFPVLSLKALGLATSHVDDRRALRYDGVAF